METTTGSAGKTPRKVREGCEWKNLELNKETIKILSKAAIDKDTVFKPFAEEILENYAKKLIAKDKKKD